ncbi:MAG: YbhB/YbcL family Raf kinase inhibitor-like protein [Patescibacteria group bacterium]
MKITSPAFGQNEVIPAAHTCDGADRPPILKISAVPTGAKTIAIVMDDPDASGRPWVHWTIWNIPARESLMLEGELPVGSVEGLTSFGTVGYGGPCPPSGTHRYFFKAYALDAELDLSSETSAAELERAISGHVLDKCGLIGVYSRE